MASELYVETLKGLTSGANANKIVVPSGQILYAPGHVIQVVTGTFGNVNLNETTTFTDIASLAITPTSTTSKIIVTFNFQLIWGSGTSGYTNGVGFRILRDSTPIREPVSNSTGPYQFFSATDQGYLRQLTTYNVTDEPTTTNVVTYKLQGRVFTTTAVTDYLNINEFSTTSETGQITIMEIAG